MSNLSKINQRFHFILKEIFTEIYESFRLEIFYVVMQGKKIILRENVIEDCIDNAAYKLFTVYTQKIDNHWNKYGDICEDKKYKYSLHWEIYLNNAFSSNNNLHNQVIQEFFQTFLVNLTEGFISYEMFSTLSQTNESNIEVVLNHLFSTVNDPVQILNLFVNKTLKKEFLPDKNELVQLSAQMYEKRPIHGSICFVPIEAYKKLLNTPLIPGTYLDLTCFAKEYRKLRLNNLRGLRKLLELNTDKTIMIAVYETENNSKESIFAGLIAYTDIIKSSLENYPQIKFNGYLKWQLSIKNVDWFTYNNGTYNICVESREDQWKRELSTLELDHNKTTDLLDIISLLSKESHGTSVIFIDKGILTGTDNIQSEIDRLCDKNRCIKINNTENQLPYSMNIKEYLRNIKGITSIDGAIIADLDGNIHAIGAILDGEAIEIGDLDKGARHNSVKNYLSVIKKKYMEFNMFGIIVSEDGNIKLEIPSPRV